MLRVSVSDLESWRYWRGGGQPVDGLVRRLLRLDPQTPAMLLGIAFEDWLMAGASTDEFEFQVEAVLPKPHAVQVSLEAVYHLPGPFVVHLAGRADAIVGATIEDWKTTSRAIQYSKYADSFQWRCYLEMSGYEDFVYRIFQINSNKEVVDYQSFSLFSYPALKHDVKRELRGFVETLLVLEQGKHISLSTGRILGPQKETIE